MNEKTYLCPICGEQMAIELEKIDYNFNFDPPTWNAVLECQNSTEHNILIDVSPRASDDARKYMDAIYADQIEGEAFSKEIPEFEKEYLESRHSTGKPCWYLHGVTPDKTTVVFAGSKLDIIKEHEFCFDTEEELDAFVSKHCLTVVNR